MDYEEALQEIKSKIGTDDGCVFINQNALANALGMKRQNISAILAGTRAIPQAMLDIAGLERIKHPDTYRKHVMEIGIEGDKWYCSNGLPQSDWNANFAFARTLRKAVKKYNADFNKQESVPERLAAYADQTPEQYKLQEASHL